MKKTSIIAPGMRVGVMGLGVSGRAAVKYALSCGAEVLISDSRQEKQFLAEEGDLSASGNIYFETGRHSHRFLSQAEIVLVSPGIGLDLALFKRLKDDGIKVVGELAIAADIISMPTIAITGTNGKTTVTTLIGNILEGAGMRVFIGGNIGTPLYEYLINPLEYDIVVVEVSSFQLETAGRFSPDIGILLNISPDHLDRHMTLNRYIDAKMRLFAHQKENDVAILNSDDPICRNISPKLKGQLYTFGQKDNNAAVIDRQEIILNLAGKREEYSFDENVQKDGISLKNYAAAILAARLQGIAAAEIKDGMQHFRPLPHRLEFVATVRGISYYNDSKATNTGAVNNALEQFHTNIILIAGGRDKGDDYSLLRKNVASRVKKIVLLGEAADRIADALAGVVDMIRASSMTDAVRLATEESQTRDVVLLSPACASFDMFADYNHRGNEFKRAVFALEATDTVP